MHSDGPHARRARPPPAAAAQKAGDRRPRGPPQDAPSARPARRARASREVALGGHPSRECGHDQPGSTARSPPFQRRANTTSPPLGAQQARGALQRGWRGPRRAPRGWPPGSSVGRRAGRLVPARVTWSMGKARAEGEAWWPLTSTVCCRSLLKKVLTLGWKFLPKLGGGGRPTQRSARRCWIHHEPDFDSNCSFKTCTTPRKRLCGAFFSCKTCFHLHTFAVEHFTPTFGMHQKRLWKRLLWCTGP